MHSLPQGQGDALLYGVGEGERAGGEFPAQYQLQHSGSAHGVGGQLAAAMFGREDECRLPVHKSNVAKIIAAVNGKRERVALVVAVQVFRPISLVWLSRF